MLKKYIDKIVENGNDEQMEELSEMLIESINEIRNYNEKSYKKYEKCLYELANGKILTDEMKREWVKNMNPEAKWTEEQVESVFKTIDNPIPAVSAYVIMNMLYSDFKDSLGEGDDDLSIKKYIQATLDWYYDKDATHSEEEKLYFYYFYIVK